MADENSVCFRTLTLYGDHMHVLIIQVYWLIPPVVWLAHVH